MSMLIVDYGLENDFKSSISTATSVLNKRIDDYTNIASRVQNIPSNTDNCSNCAYFVRKKSQQLQGKVTKLNGLKKQVDTFVDDVKETDRKVASRIKKDTKSFKKRTGIGKTSKSLWASICEEVGDFFEWVGEEVTEIWDNIKQWYEDNKYWINIVVDVVMVVAAVAACIGTGGLALAVGVFFVVDAACDLIYDGAAAYQYYVEGNEAEAERLSGKGGKDAFIWLGSKADEVLGTDFMAGTMGIIYEGISLFAVGYSLYKAVFEPAKQLLKDLKLDKIKLRSPIKFTKGKIKFRSVFHGNFKLKTHFTGDKLWKATTNFFGAKAVQQKEVVKLAYKINKLGVKKLTTCFKAADSLLNFRRWKSGYEGVKGTYEKINTAVNLMKEGKNPFQKTEKAVEEFYIQIKLINSGGIV